MLDRNNITYSLYEGGSSGNIMLYAGIGAAVVVVIVVLAVVLGRKKKAPAAGAKAEEKSAASPVLRSLSPQHGGMVVQLHHQQPVQIGRTAPPAAWCIRTARRASAPTTARCTMTSGEHVRGDGPELTYGTFLAGGQRLQPNTPAKLAPKSSFYLGEVDNTVYVDVE